MGDRPLSQTALRDRERAARLSLLYAAEDFRRENGGSLRSSDAAFCELYNRGELEPASSVRECVKRLSTSTLSRWRSLVRAGTSDRLGFDRGAARRGKGALETAAGGNVLIRIRGLISGRPISAASVRRQIIAEFPDFQAPPVRTFQHFIMHLRSRRNAPVADTGLPHSQASAIALSAQVVLNVIVVTMKRIEAELPSKMRSRQLKALRGASGVVRHLQRAAEEEAAAPKASV